MARQLLFKSKYIICAVLHIFHAIQNNKEIQQRIPVFSISIPELQFRSFQALEHFLRHHE